MLNLDQAINILENEDISFVVIKNNEIIKDKAIGIKPIFQRIKQDKNFFKNAIIADKIIGKAAALLLVSSGIREVYGQTMSKTAIEVLENHKTYYRYGKKVDFIHNRDNTGLCPMEETVKEIHNPENAFIPLGKTIDALMAKNQG